MAGLFYGLHFGSWVWSLTLLGLLTGRDRPSARLAASLAVAVVGVTLIGWADLSASGDALLGDALALLGAVAMAGYLLVGHRAGAPRRSGRTGLTRLAGTSDDTKGSKERRPAPLGCTR